MRSTLKWVQLAIAALLVVLIFMPWFEVRIDIAGTNASGYDLIMNAYNCTAGESARCQNADYAGWVVALAGVLLVIGLLIFFRSGMPFVYRLICSVLYLLVPLYAIYAVGQEGNIGIMGEIGMGDVLSEAVWDMYSGWLKLALLLCIVFIFVPQED